MPVRNDREYRFSGPFEIRKDGEKPIVRGYASTFDSYKLWEDPDGYEWREQIMPGAFDGADLSDVIFCRDHKPPVFARTSNGYLVLSVDGHGLLTEVDLTHTAAAREMMEDIEVGNYSQMSFSFVVDKDGDRYEQKGKVITRYIDHLKKIFDVSAVAFPANPGTSIGLSYRDLFNGEIERIKAERLKAIQERERLKLRLRLIERS